MKRYVLITVCEREITTHTYNTKEEAQKFMREELINAIHDDEVEELIGQGQEYFDNCQIAEYSAWANNTKAGNWDWQIVEIII